MFSRLVAILLIITVSLSSLTRCMLFTAFKLNQNYIASILCINKDKPQLHCQGKCYLTKKLKQADEKERSQQQQSQKKQYEEVVVTERVTIFSPVRLLQKSYLLAEPGDPSKFSSLIFQPPKV